MIDLHESKTHAIADTDCIEFNSPMVISTYRFFCILYLYHTGLPVRFNENQDGPAAYNVLNYFVSLRSEILCCFFLL